MNKVEQGSARTCRRQGGLAHLLAEILRADRLTLRQHHRRERNSRSATVLDPVSCRPHWAWSETCAARRATQIEANRAQWGLLRTTQLEPGRPHSGALLPARQGQRWCQGVSASASVCPKHSNGERPRCPCLDSTKLIKQVQEFYACKRKPTLATHPFQHVKNKNCLGRANAQVERCGSERHLKKSTI